MDFGFTEEQELFRKTVRLFADRELAPHCAAQERDDFPVSELMGRLAKVDLLGLRTPVEYGGSDQSFVTYGIAVEEVARFDYCASGIVMGSALAGDLLGRFASPRVKAEWLPEIVGGRRRIGVALTEPHCGSDSAALTTRAERQGGEYVINGEKSSITGIDFDGWVMFVRTLPVPGARGISALVVPRDTPGLATSRFNDLGLRMFRRGAIHVDNARVPADHLVGEEGQAFRMMMDGFDYNRALIALRCVATAQRTVDETIEYVKTRSAFGQPIARFEGVSFPIAEAYTLLETTRLLCYKVLWLRDRGLPHTKEGAMAKWLGPKQAVDIIHQMLLLHGHAGYSDDYPIERRLRDVMGHEIGDGTPEVMKLVIAREVIGREVRAN